MFPALLHRNQDGAYEFESSSLAYDCVQCHDEIKKGDIIVIPSERVVAVADTWPFAVTNEHGAMHPRRRESSWIQVADSRKIGLHKIHAAIDLARKLGYEVQS